MEFLKEILGDELFKQIESKINEHNGIEANADKQIKIGNLGSGEYVAKGKYDSEIEKLNAIISGKDTELETANNLIADFKKNTKGNEELQKQLAETKIKSAVKVGLLSEKCNDIDYVTYVIEKELKEQGKTLELDENENIKGWDDLISNAKTKLPTQFEAAKGNGKIIEENKLPKSEDRKTEPTSLAEALQMKYETN